MRDKEKAKSYNALYREKHWFAIKLKNQMYRRLSHVKTRRREHNANRKDYLKKYYQEHKEIFISNAAQWVRENPEKRKFILKRFKEKLKRKRFGNRQKIKRIVGEFIEYCKERYAKDTVRQYKMNMERFLACIAKPGVRCKGYHAQWYQERKKPPQERDYSWAKDYHKIRLMEDLDRDVIINYVGYVNNDEMNKKGMKLNQSEKESRLYPLKTFLLFCQRKGIIKKDLRKFIVVPAREEKILKRILAQEEIMRLIESPNINKPQGIRDRALLELSYSGFRANEILTLKLGHLDLNTNAATILNAKGDKDRIVPMTTEAIYWIKRWLNIKYKFLGNRQENKEYLFVTKGAKPIPRRNLSKLIKKYAKKANIPIDVSPHDLRRTTATHLAENGAPVRLIQALLGHATLKVTTKYLRLSDEKIKKAHKETHPSNRRNLYYGALQG